jgi:hypothetical protein
MIFSTSKLQNNDSKIYYRCVGFLSDRDVLQWIKCFNYRHDPAQVVIDLRLTRITGQYGAMAIAALVLEYRHFGKTVTLLGLDAESQEICDHTLAIQASNPRLLADHLHGVLDALSMA